MFNNNNNNMFIRAKIQGIKVHIMTFKYKSIISKIEWSSSMDKNVK